MMGTKRVKLSYNARVYFMNYSKFERRLQGNIES